MARFTEALMGSGEWSALVDYRPDVAAELLDDEGRPRKVHVRVYDADDELLYTGLLLRAEADRTGIAIGGRNLRWWLGFDGDGPKIADREFVSGFNKLSNGDYGLDDLYWRVGEGWAVGGGVAASGTTAKDSTLESDERFPTRPGYEYTVAVVESRAVSDAGRLRLRTIYEGTFAHPDILPGDWDDQSDTPGDVSIAGGTIVLGPCTQYSPVLNPRFDSDLSGWVQVAGTWAHTTAEYFSPPGAATTAGGGPNPKYLQADSDPGTGPVDPHFFAPGQKWRFEGALKGDAAADGEATIQLYIADLAWPANPTWMVIARVLGTDGDKQNWRYEQVELTVPEAKVAFVPMLVVYGHTAGNWYWDEVVATRTAGNVARAVDLDLAAVTPERPYVWRATVRSGADLKGGNLRLCMWAYGNDRPTVRLESPVVEATAGDERAVEWRFETPSGYDVIQTFIEVVDATGDSFTVTAQSIVDADPKTAVLDVRAAGGTHGPSLLLRTSTAPPGAEWVRLSVVAESKCGGFVVDDAHLFRTDAGPTTGNEIVAELLAGTSIVAGDVDCPENIPYDWHVLDLTPLEALDHYCRVVSDPPREYRLNPDRTLDVAAAGALFTDHAPGTATAILLLEEDLDVPGGIPPVVADAEKRATEIRVIGAERSTVSGRKVIITATAQVPGTPEVDWNGNPVRRTRIVSDSTVDHFGYADALAVDLAAAEAEPPLAIEATLSGIGTRPAFGAGDWVYVCKPTAGIQDLANPTMVDGEVVFPRRLRVLSLTRRLGPSHRIEVRRADGTTFDLPGVRWEPEDATDLKLGERPRSFVADPQGGNAGRQYLRDRASSPR